MKTFAVSKVGLDPGGRITAVLWGQVDTGKNACGIDCVAAGRLAVSRARRIATHL